MGSPRSALCAHGLSPLLPAGHLEVLKLLVARGADVACKDKKGYTLLHTAAASGQIEVVRHLLRLGVEVRPQPGPGSRAAWQRGLLCGCPFFPPFFPSQSLNPLGLLLPQIDEPNSFGNTALHIACYMGQDAVANELVNYGANVNQPNEKGFTPLHFAAVSTNGALCLELLVNNGADVNFQVWCRGLSPGWGCGGPLPWGELGVVTGA